MNGLPVVVIPADDPPLVSRSPFLDQLREFTDVRLYCDRPASESELIERLAPADILLNSRSAVRITSTVIQSLPRLRMISVCGIGYDAIELEAADARGIAVCNIPGRTAAIVAEHAFGLMLAVSRRMAWMTAELRRGHWPDDLGTSLLNKQVGIVGTGNIGLQMARLCRGFGMDVVAWTFHPDQSKADEIGFRYVELEQLLQTSDVVSLHVRLTDVTRGMLGARQLRLMKRGAILVNTARAAVVDTSALVSSLNDGHLFGAGIDVFDQEPIAPDHELLKCDHVVLTPHSADQTQEGIDMLTQGCVENIRAFLEGRPQNVVNHPCGNGAS